MIVAEGIPDPTVLYRVRDGAYAAEEPVPDEVPEELILAVLAARKGSASL